MNTKHHIIIIPGLSDNTKNLELISKMWSKYGFHFHVFYMGWKDNEKFEQKLDRLLELVDKLNTSGKVSIIGTSAGGSAAFNVFSKKANKIHRAVNVCGRLRKGVNTGFRSFEARTKNSISFKESIIMFETNEPKIKVNDKKRLMSITAIWDELVPKKTSIIKNSNNYFIPTIGHVFSISMALTLFKKRIIKFLLSK